MPESEAPARARPKPKSISIDERFCSGCGICIEFCPRNVLAASETMSIRGVYPASVVALDQCIVCRLCELYCGSFAIAVEEV